MSDKILDPALSEARLEANRNNAKKSTGPRSIEGKSRSSQNSWKHGLTGATALLPSDNRDAFEEYVAGILDSLHPGSLLEHEICRDVADAHWRLRRIHSVYTKMIIPLAPPPTPSAPFDPLLFHDPDERPIPRREDVLYAAAPICLEAPNSLTNTS